MLSLQIVDFEDDPDRVTDILGIQPTSVRRKGDVLLSGRRTAQHNSWRLTVDTHFTGGSSHEEALSGILNAIRGHQRQFAALREQIRPRSVTIYGGLYKDFDQQCGVWLDASAMRLLADCAIDWGLDLYTEQPDGDNAPATAR